VGWGGGQRWPREQKKRRREQAKLNTKTEGHKVTALMMEHAILSNAGVGKRVRERERGKER